MSADGTVEQIATVDGTVTGLAARRGVLYWTLERQRDDPTTGPPTTGHIASMTLAEGNVVEFDTQAASLGRIGVSDSDAYWADFDRGIFSAPIVDGSVFGPERFFAGFINALGVFVDDDTVYWTQMNVDNSVRKRVVGQPNTDLLACHQQWPGGLHVDQSRMYWINRFIHESTGRIMALERPGGVPKVLLDGRESPSQGSLIGSVDHLYWIEGSSAILRMAK